MSDELEFGGENSNLRNTCLKYYYAYHIYFPFPYFLYFLCQSDILEMNKKKKIS